MRSLITLFLIQGFLIFFNNAFCFEINFDNRDGQWKAISSANQEFEFTQTDNTLEGDIDEKFLVGKCSSRNYSETLKDFNVKVNVTCEGQHFIASFVHKTLDGEEPVKLSKIPQGVNFFVVTESPKVETKESKLTASAEPSPPTSPSPAGGCASGGMNLYVFLITMMGLGLIKKYRSEV